MGYLCFYYETLRKGGSDALYISVVYVIAISGIPVVDMLMLYHTRLIFLKF